MWRLLRYSLRYHRGTLLVSWTIGLGSAALVLGLIAGLDGKALLAVLREASVAAPVSVLVASMVAGFIMSGCESEEKRLQLTATLPLAVREAAFHRALLPVLAVLLGSALAALIMLVLAALGVLEPSLRRLHRTAVIAAELSFWVQLPLMIGELKDRLGARRNLAALGPGAALVLLISAVIWAELGASSRTVELLLAGLASAGMVVGNGLFFQDRRSFA